MSLVITDAGIAASKRAGTLGIEYQIAEISIGTAGYVPSKSQTALKNEILRKPITKGEVVGLGQIHLETVWNGNEEFQGKELGYWLNDGTLFAVDSRNGEVITYKQRNTVVTEAVELNLAASSITNISVELIGVPSATDDDIDNKAVTGKLIKLPQFWRALSNLLSNSYTGTRTDKAVTEKALKDGLATKWNYTTAKINRWGATLLSNNYQGTSQHRAITEMGVKDGLEWLQYKMELLISGKSDVGHLHDEFYEKTISDSRYFRNYAGVVYPADLNDDRPSGSYRVSYSGHSELLLDIGVLIGSTPRLQLKAHFADKLSFRCARDSTTNWDSGEWQQLYHTGNKPNASDVGAYSTAQSDSRFLRSDTNDDFSGDIVSTARNRGVFGVYDSHKTDQIWSMGTAYRNDSNGNDFGTLYGLAYKHTNNPTGGTMAGGHQAVWCIYGKPKSAMGEDGLWGEKVYDGAGNNRSRVYSRNNLRAALNDICPAGVPLPYPHATAPFGWLECRGQTFNKSAYPILAEAYPSGRLPDMRAATIRGLDNGRGIDGGRSVLSQQSAQSNNLHQVNVTPNDVGISGTITIPQNGQWSGYITGVSQNDGMRFKLTGAETRVFNIAFIHIVRAA